MTTPGDGPQATLLVRVRPRASKSAIIGRRGQTLHLQVAAPPVDGAANEACLAFLAKLLRTTPNSKQGRDVAPRLAIIKGAGSRDKVIRIFGLTQDQIEARLAEVPSVAGSPNA